jgi:hypothetical protein
MHSTPIEGESPCSGARPECSGARLAKERTGSAFYRNALLLSPRERGESLARPAQNMRRRKAGTCGHRANSHPNEWNAHMLKPMNGCSKRTYKLDKNANYTDIINEVINFGCTVAMPHILKRCPCRLWRRALGNGRFRGVAVACAHDGRTPTLDLNE